MVIIPLLIFQANGSLILSCLTAHYICTNASIAPPSLSAHKSL